MNPRALCAGTMLLAASAFATPIEQPTVWAFDGYVAGFGLPGGACLAQGCQDILSSSFSGRITFDLSAPDLDPDPNHGLYRSVGGPYGLHIEIGAYTYDTHYVQTSIHSHAVDQVYGFFMQEQGPWFDRVGLFGFFDLNLGILTSDKQLATPPLPWRGGYEPQYLSTLGGADLALRITNIHAVPEPATSAMVLLGLGIAGFFVRRSKGGVDHF